MLTLCLKIWVSFLDHSDWTPSHLHPASVLGCELQLTRRTIKHLEALSIRSSAVLLDSCVARQAAPGPDSWHWSCRLSGDSAELLVQALVISHKHPPRPPPSSCASKIVSSALFHWQTTTPARIPFAEPDWPFLLSVAAVSSLLRLRWWNDLPVLVTNSSFSLSAPSQLKTTPRATQYFCLPLTQSTQTSPSASPQRSLKSLCSLIS